MINMDKILAVNKVFENFMGYFNGHKETMMFMGVYILILIYIWFKKDKDKIQMLIPMTIFLAVTVFNFLMMEYIVIPMGLKAEWYRMYWLLPVIPVTAYGALEIIHMQEKSIKKWVLSGMCVICIILCGQPIWGFGYECQENPYKVRKELVEIANIIHNDCADQTVKVLFPEEYYLNEMRQYDASIIMSTWKSVVGEVTREFQNTGTYALAEDDVRQRSQEVLVLANVCSYGVGQEEIYRALYITETQYVVCDTTTGSLEYFLEAGCQKVGDAGQYSILKVIY